MITFGIIFLALGYLFNVSVLWVLDLILLVAGLALMVAGRVGHAHRWPEPLLLNCHLTAKEPPSCDISGYS